MRWEFVIFGTLADQLEIDIQTGPFGTQLKASDYTDNGIPVINVRNIGNGNLRPEKLEFVSESTAYRLQRHLLQEGDIVFGRKGAVDRHLLVSKKQHGWMQGSDCIRLRVCSDKLNPQFISYSLLQDGHKKWMIAQCSNKSTMASLNQDVIKRICIRVPERYLQDEIVAVLSSYDDLIENNRRRIELLEQAARLLYKEWFVHFRFPGHEQVRIIEGVPEGWQQKHLSQLVTTQYGYTETARKEPVGPKFLRGTDINKTSYIDWSTIPYCIDNNLDFNKFKLDIGDIVVIRMADPGKVGIIEKDISAIFASYLVRMKVLNRNEITSYYLFYTLSDLAYQGFVIGASTGSTRKSASAKLLVDFNINIPPTLLLTLFDKYIIPIRKQITCLLDQNAKLREARDLLLPRIMNGEIAL